MARLAWLELNTSPSQLKLSKGSTSVHGSLNVHHIIYIIEILGK